MSLKDRISDDMKSAMRAKDSARLGTIRLLLAAIKQKEVDERITLDDTQITAVIDKMLKQRRDSISQYEGAGRTDLADAEKLELEVLTGYMPQQMGTDEVRGVIAEVIASVGATGPADMGKVMGPLKERLAGRTDMAQASALVKAALSGSAS
ncbi:MAG: GatB/YqeY domain-containing protein [Gammaproteobacteria bacterium]|jgi:uncharacterized protein|nr:GatB/YqeY domain-containing protein [Gammaproteobacteria bacterium]MBU0773259.1 GatB/YqeY domain-containing protein [Gammaproteobacteria bacterium]MBU0857830.1 GatB/YqeY domain-containing protein [Gammaproteobacteria bacterium]MBU1846016.1 GatB/YqeY domain-containing protein [Gammaproteobacteria bacterium]